MSTLVVTGKWAPKTPIKNKCDASEAAREITALRKGGYVTAPRLLERASDPESCMHEMFPWDDEAAAYEHRLHIARKILSHLHVVQPDGREHRMLLAVSVTSEEQKAYVPFQQAFRVPEWTEEVQRNALAELKGWRTRYKDYTDLGPIVKSVDRILVRFGKKD